MVHDLTVTRFGYRLRPWSLDDSAFIVELRNDPRTSQFIGAGADSVEAQQNWMSKQLQLANDYGFIIESATDRMPVGMLSIYNIKGDQGEWGRWVISPGIPAAPASAWMSLHLCFDVLKLNSVIGCVVAANKPVISLHRRMGYKQVTPEPCILEFRGVPTPHLIFEAKQGQWNQMSSLIAQTASQAEQLFRKCHEFI